MTVAVLAVIGAVLLSGGVVYFWAQGQIQDRDVLVQEAVEAKTTARNDANAALAVNAQLQVDIADLEEKLKDQKDQSKIYKGQSESAQQQLQHTQDKLKQKKGELAAVTGPKLSNGDHIGYILAAGSAQTPPMMAINTGRWFTGSQAQQAALADGAIVAGEHVKHGRYLRTTDGIWRIVEVSTGATFTVHHYNGVSTPTAVSLSTLAQILASPDAHDERTSHNPFWVTISGGQVTGGREQSYQSP